MMKYAAFRYGFYQNPWRHVSPKSSNILHFYWEKPWFWVAQSLEKYTSGIPDLPWWAPGDAEASPPVYRSI